MYLFLFAQKKIKQKQKMRKTFHEDVTVSAIVEWGKRRGRHLGRATMNYMELKTTTTNRFSIDWLCYGNWIICCVIPSTMGSASVGIHRRFKSKHMFFWVRSSKLIASGRGSFKFQSGLIFMTRCWWFTWNCLVCRRLGIRLQLISVPL